MHVLDQPCATAADIEHRATALAARLGNRGGAEFDLAPQVLMRATVTRDPTSGGRCWRSTLFRPGRDPEHRCRPSAVDAVRDLLQTYPGATLVRAIDGTGFQYPRDAHNRPSARM